ncbi:arylsulfotransferase family protein [Gordonia sp. VNQ95]|uniref:arylsulfotransferase family protein n=1 Tax=Gordonia TaxID=2053 RepID=UPI0032B44990
MMRIVLRRMAVALCAVVVGMTVVVGPVHAAPAADIYRVNLDSRPGTPGVILLAPDDLLNNPAVPRVGGNSAHAPVELQVRTRAGKLLARHVIPDGQSAGNFQIQSYGGQRVYTWWQGTSKPGHGSGSYYIADRDFRVLRTIRTPAGSSGDLHEFRILADGRAAVTSYAPVATSVNGVPLRVIDSRFYIIDIDSGRAEFSWSSLAHVPVAANTTPWPVPGEGLDYFHINSIVADGSGNYLISSRNTSALYLIDGTTGQVRWRLGGNNSTLRVEANATFANQHDAEFLPDGSIRLFDNHAAVPAVGGGSSVLTVRPDFAHGVVRLVSRWEHPQRLTAWAMGNAQTLADGSVFGGWGTTGHISQFDARGHLVYDANLSGTLTTYRAFFYPTGL